jgi:hypothetical protein
VLVLLPQTVLLLLQFASAIPAADAGMLHATPSPAPHQAIPFLTEQLRIVEQTAQRFGDPLLSCTSVALLDEALTETIDRSEFLTAYMELAHTFSRIRVDVAWPTDALPKFIQTRLKPLSNETRAKFIQGLAVTLEIWQRLPAFTLPPPNVALSELTNLRDANIEFRYILTGEVCGLAVARLLAGQGAKARRDVVDHLVDRWFRANRRLLAQLDPLQAALDSAVSSFSEPTQSSVVRVAYAWDTSEDNDVSGPSLVIWLVLRDDTDPRARTVSGNIELMRAVNHALETVNMSGMPFFLRLRMASEFA